MLFNLFFLALVAVVAFAVYSNYSKTDPTLPWYSRSWESIVLAFGALVALAGGWFAAG